MEIKLAGPGSRGERAKKKEKEREREREREKASHLERAD